MKQVLIRAGATIVEEVPAPRRGPGELLVAVARSCVSAGTEGAGLALSAMPLWRRALKQRGGDGETQAIGAAKPWRADDKFVATLSFADGMVLSLDDYTRLDIAGRRTKSWSGRPDKGHAALIEALAEGLRGGHWPIPLEQQIVATRASFAVQRLISP